nr:hypothetical protein [Tanacetum cinerariifolium]
MMNLVSHGLMMEYHMKCEIIFANLSISGMGKLNGLPAILMKMDFVMVENYRGWFRNVQNKEEHENEERCEFFYDTAQEPPVCEIRRFEMIKYSFGQEEKYVPIKEYEYDDSTRTNKDACHAYQEIFHNMDEVWLVTRAE